MVQKYADLHVSDGEFSPEEVVKAARDVGSWPVGTADHDKQFQAMLKTVQEIRRWREELMVTKLQKLGVGISFDEVPAEAGKGSIGRPHLARELLKRGHVKTYEAFERYLISGCPAYVGKYEMTPGQSS